MSTSRKQPNRRRTLADYPDVAAQLHPTKNDDLKASDVNPGSHRVVWWLHVAEFGPDHEWQASICHRINGTGCPICNGKTVLAGFNDLATTHPDTADEADGWNVTTVSFGFHKKVTWRCSPYGHTWHAAVCDRTRGTCPNCPYCSGRAVWPGFNDLATTHPDIAAEADEWDATTVSAGSGKKMPWRCGKHGHTWRASVAGRTARKHDCPYCSGQAVWPGFNDLATTHPLVAGEADGWDATTVTRGTNKKMPWRCGKHGHTWRAAVRDRTTGRNCPSCNEGGGFNPSKPGYLYLLENVVTGLLKVGISNVPKRRFRDHATNGLTPIDVQGPYNDGALAQSWERDILAFLRSNGAQFADRIGIEPFDGYTECWLRDSFPVTTIAELKNLVQDAEAA
jgi:hypothetical protein